MLNRLGYYTISLLFSIYILMLYFFNQLTFYIHPRYVTFALIMGIVGLVFSLLGLVVSLFSERKRLGKLIKNAVKELTADRKLILFVVALVISFFVNLFFIVAALIVLLPLPDSKFDKLLRGNNWGTALLVITLGVAFMLPARPLSAATADQRALDFNALNISDSSDKSQPFSFSSAEYDLGGWVKSLNINPDVNSYVGKQVVVSGFVYMPEEIPSELFTVARFVITCCAVDARPVGLLVDHDVQDTLQENDWVEVKGKFTLMEVNGKQQIVVEPESVTKIDTPSNPYIF
jgi:uncharacterized repeat protein (TIGR03943 family)